MYGATTALAGVCSHPVPIAQDRSSCARSPQPRESEAPRDAHASERPQADRHALGDPQAPLSLSSRSPAPSGAPACVLLHGRPSTERTPIQGAAMQDGLERALDELVQLRPDFGHLAIAGRDAIVVEDLRKTYPDGTEAVRGVTLRVARGECYGLLGPNGAGKSTTVGMLGTLVRPTSGRAVVAGFDVVEQPREARRRIGFAMQEVGVDAFATARELLVLQGRLHGLRRAEADHRARLLLMVVDLAAAAGPPGSVAHAPARRGVLGRADRGA